MPPLSPALTRLPMTDPTHRASLADAAVAGAGDASTAVNGWPTAYSGSRPVTRAPVHTCAAAASAGAAPSCPMEPLRRSLPVLLVDGANIAFSHGRDTFSSRGIRLCVEYFLSHRARRRLRADGIAVILSESRRDPADPHLAYLDALGVLSFTPVGKYDDLFLLQCAADHGAWVVTNDKWREPRAARHATEAVRKRTICFTFMHDAFSPSPDDLANFDNGRAAG